MVARQLMPYENIKPEHYPAPVPQEASVRAWSFSAWKNYTECPQRFKYERINKLQPKQPVDRKALVRGEQYHKDAENYLKDRLHEVPPSFKLIPEKMQKLKTLDPICEEMWAFDRWWRPIPLNERGFTEDFADKDKIWVRMKLDAAVFSKENTLCVAIDFKTGDLKEDHPLQLELQALGVLCKYPTVNEVYSEAWYSDQRLVLQHDDNPFTRKDIDKLIMKWEQRVKAMFTDTRHAAKPGRYCTWCPYSRAKGGPCKF